MFRPKPIALILFIGIAVVMLSSCAPTITDFDPKRGKVGTEVTINGENFKPNAADNTVKFADTTATNILQASENQIVVEVPSGAETGKISVKTSEGTAYSGEDFTVVDEKPKWTFMVYLDADNNLESAGIDDFLEMASVGSSSDVNIVVQMDRRADYDNTYGDWTGTRRFLIQKNDTPATTPLVDLEEANMGHPDTLRDFVLWAVQNYPAQHYALSIWNHGDGWREDLEKRQSRALARAPGEEGVALRTVASDDTDNDVLYMSEVQSALQATEVKLDVVGFDACLMGMIEVAYALRNVANHVVGSEWVEPGDGWPYDTILAELISTPTFDGSDLSGVIVTKYGLAYSGGITQSSVDMKQLNNVVSKIDAFAAAMSTEWAALQTAHGNTISYHYWGLSTWGIDLWHFADNVYNEVTSAAIKSAALDLKNAIDAFMVKEHHSSDKDGSHGVAIYFPADRTTFNNDPDHTGYVQTNTIYPVDFVKQHGWDEFLQTYYTNTGP